MNTDMDAVGLPAAPGGPSPAGTILRAAVYIDGFNLYHAIDELGEPHLKWLNLWKLSEQLIRRGESLRRVVWCTAQYTRSVPKMLRWRLLRDAQLSAGVICVQGHFAGEEVKCRADCKKEFWKDSEKEGDVNTAIHLISDAHLNVYDVAYLVTADSDQVGTARLFKERFPRKQLVSIAPPNKSHSKDIINHVDDHKIIDKSTIELCLFAKNVIEGGRLIANRPPEYNPPPGWRNPAPRPTVVLPPRRP